MRQIVVRSGATAVVPDEPPGEMIVSIQHGLRWIERAHAPTPSDAWLLVLADQPTIRPEVLDTLARHWCDSDREILIPVCDGRRGHPVLFCWSLADEVLNLPPDVGLNQLVRRAGSKVEEVPVTAPEVLADLDTPEDYARLRGR